MRNKKNDPNVIREIINKNKEKAKLIILSFP